MANVTASSYFQFLLIAIISLFLGNYFFSSQDFCCDAVNYLQLSHDISVNGLFQFENPLRTFGYPLFISLTGYEHSAESVGELGSLYLVQHLIYLFSALYFAHTICEILKISWRLIVFFMLTFNPYALALIYVPLADILYVSAVLGVISLVLKSIFVDSDYKSIQIALAAAFLGLAIIIRPAGIWVIPIVLIGMIVLVFRDKLFWPVAFGAMSLFMVLFFQILLNVKFFNQFTFFPTIELGQKQIEWGISNFKYATFIGNEGPVANGYSSKNMLGDAVITTGYSWYLRNPYLGFKLISLKLAASMHWDFLKPYPNDRSNLVNYFSIVVMFIIHAGLWNIVATITNKSNTDRKYIAMFFTSILVSWGVIHLPSAIELRFTMPILLLITPFAVKQFEVLTVTMNRYKTVFFIITIIATTSINYSLAHYVSKFAAF